MSTSVPGPTTEQSPQRSSRPHAHSDLPPGCVRGPTLGLTPRGVVSQPSAGDERIPIIWVDFPPSSTNNPFFFSTRKKVVIMIVALFFGNITAYQTSAYSIGFTSMKRDLGATDLQAAAGVSLYGWGFALGPLALAPLTEEFGRYWMYIGSIGTYMLCHLTQTLAQNIGTVLVGRFLLGLTGCIGATVVSGTVSDIFPPQNQFASGMAVDRMDPNDRACCVLADRILCPSRDQSTCHSSSAREEA
ncbi:hypothetical protein IAU59_003661 [Kwoniella sp. CBS 9459]